MVMGTPSTPAAPSWPGTSGVRDATRCHPRVTRGWRDSSTGREARGAGNAQISWITGKKFTDTSAGLEKGAEDGNRQGSMSVSVPVANKWIHEHGQEFRRPCSADPQD